MRAIDVLPAAAAEAHVMQPNASLDEAPTRIRRVAAIDADSGPAAHVISKILACEHLLQPDEGQQALDRMFDIGPIR